MKYIADENIPFRVVEKLKKDGISIESVIHIRPGMMDREIVEVSRNKKAVIITFDKDFGELAFKSFLKPHGVIFLRIRPKSVEYIYSFLKWLLMELGIEFEGKFVVAKEDKIREIKMD